MISLLPLAWQELIEPLPHCGCWLWTGVVSGSGYARYGRLYVHRTVYELLVGPIPPLHELDHSCKLRACVRPAHVEPVLHRTNTLRNSGPTAANARKLVCPRCGQPYSREPNTNRRRCVPCHRQNIRVRRLRNRLEIQGFLPLVES